MYETLGDTGSLPEPHHNEDEDISQESAAGTNVLFHAVVETAEIVG